MRTVYFGRTAWKDPDFCVLAAKKWFGVMSAGEIEVELVLNKVARGEYPKILVDMDEFLKCCMASKHSSNEKGVENFFKSLVESVLHQIAPECHGVDGVRQLSMNIRWEESEILTLKINSACLEKGLPLVLK